MPVLYCWAWLLTCPPCPCLPLPALLLQGIRNLPVEEADRLASADPDYSIRDLYNAIATGDCPSWTMYIQVMTFEQAERSRFNPFDLTKVWSHKEFPLIEVGRMVLNRNPANYFAEVEQLAFAPAHMVPGIEPSPDKMLQVSGTAKAAAPQVSLDRRGHEPDVSHSGPVAHPCGVCRGLAGPSVLVRRHAPPPPGCQLPANPHQPPLQLQGMLVWEGGGTGPHARDQTG